MSDPSSGRDIRDVIKLAREAVSGNAPQGSVAALKAGQLIRAWLRAANPAFDNKSPAEMMKTKDGVEVVKSLLLDFKDGF